MSGVTRARWCAKLQLWLRDLRFLPRHHRYCGGMVCCWLIYVSQMLEPIQKQMKVDEAAVRGPFLEYSLTAVIGEWVAQVQPPFEIVACANVVARENVRPPQAT